MIDLLTGRDAGCYKPEAAVPAQAPASARGAAPSARRVFRWNQQARRTRASGGQSHSYKITMISGQYPQCGIDQRDRDVAVAGCFMPDGKGDASEGTVIIRFIG